MKKLFFLTCTFLFLVIILNPEAHGQISGELVDIHYPSSITPGEKLAVTITVTNTGLGTWNNVCAYVGYVVSDLPVLAICLDGGMLGPGDSRSYTCSTESGIRGTPERIWAGIGTPFG